MIAVDTNILAPFYIDDPNDLESAKQHPLTNQVAVKTSSMG